MNVAVIAGALDPSTSSPCLSAAWIKVKGKDEQLQKLRANPYPCDQFDFISSSECSLKKHVDDIHGIHRCKECEFEVNDKEKLERHICKLNLQNPSNKSLYMKNWIVKDSCSPVFCNNFKKEVAILHSNDCYGSATLFRLKPLNKESCQDLPDDFIKINPDKTDATFNLHSE